PEGECEQDHERRRIGPEHDEQTSGQPPPSGLRQDQELHRTGRRTEGEAERERARKSGSSGHIPPPANRSSASVIRPSSCRVIITPSHSLIGATSRPVRPFAARSTSGVWLIASASPPSGIWSSNARTPAARPSGEPPVASCPARPGITAGIGGSCWPAPRRIHAAVSAARSAGETKTAS